MDIVPHAAGALSVLGSIDSVSRLASVANNIRSVTTTLGSLKRRISDERANLRNLRQRVREHESSNSPRNTTQNRRMARRGRRSATTVRRKIRKPTDSRPSPYIIPKNITLAQCLGKELKHVYLNSTTQQSTTDTNATFWHCAKSTGTTLLETLAPIARGTGDNQRDGRAVCLQWLKLIGRVSFSDQSQATVGNLDPIHLSIVLVLDRQSNQAGFPANGSGTPDDQLDALYQPSGSITAPFQAADQDDKQRYKVLKRKDYIYNPPSMIYDGSSYRTPSISKKFKMFVRFSGLEMLFDGGTGAASEIVSNNLFVVIGYHNPNGHGWTVQFAADCAFTG